MGLFTDTVNSKYTVRIESDQMIDAFFQDTMSRTSRQQLEEAICANMHRLTQQHFSTQLARLPRSISAKQLMDVLLAAHKGSNNGVDSYGP